MAAESDLLPSPRMLRLAACRQALLDARSAPCYFCKQAPGDDHAMFYLVHIRGPKLFRVSAQSRRVSLARLTAELAKCAAMCQRCAAIFSRFCQCMVAPKPYLPKPTSPIERQVLRDVERRWQRSEYPFDRSSATLDSMTSPVPPLLNS